MSDLIDEAAIQEFANESLEHLDEIEPELMRIEPQSEALDHETVNKIFRAIHSIKGGAGFMPAESLKTLSHSMEQVLIQIRDGKQTFTADMVDCLLQCVDRLREMLQAMIDGDATCGAIACGAEINALAALAAMPAPDAPRLDIDLALVEKAAKQGNYFYLLSFTTKQLEDAGFTFDSLRESLLTMGKFLAVKFDDAGLENRPSEMIALYATVLDADLITSAVPLPSECVRSMTLEQLNGASDDRRQPNAPPGDGKPIPPDQPIPPDKTILPDKPLDEKAQPIQMPLDANSGDARSENGPPIESTPAPTPSSASSAGESQSIRVRLDVLDQLMNMVGELVLSRNRIMQTLENHKKSIDGLEPLLQNLDFITSEIQESFMLTRMQPIGIIFSRFRRLIRDLSKQFGKSIEFQTVGDHIELDRTVLELLTDPLVHILRNSADHGLEMPEARLRLDKTEPGRIEMRVEQKCGKVYIAIKDNGRGIDAEVIRKKAVEKKLIAAEKAEYCSSKELLQLIFAPGFSTAAKVTEVSGRGVGMDVVRHNIEKLGGAIDIDTELNVGTTIMLALPQNVSIMSSLIIQSGHQRYAVPQINLVELAVLDCGEIPSRIHQIHDDLVLRLRDDLYPLLSLSEVFGFRRRYWDENAQEWKAERRESCLDKRQEINLPIDYSSSVFNSLRKDVQNRRRNIEANQVVVLMVRDGDQQFGIMIDQIIDTEEIVVKALSSYARSSALFSGASILGDGSVILILDIAGLSRFSKLQYGNLDPYRTKANAKQSSSDEATTPALLFCVDPEECFAIPFDRVKRIEPVSAASIQRIGDKHFIPCQDEGLPVFRLDEYLPIRPLPDALDDLFVIILALKDGRLARPSDCIGVLVSDIINNVSLPKVLKPPCTPAPGLIGSCVWNGKLVQMVDPIPMLNPSGAAAS